jgi:hypothetical protein
VLGTIHKDILTFAIETLVFTLGSTCKLAALCYFHFYVLEDPATISTFTVLYTCAYNYVIENPANLCNLKLQVHQ